MSLDVMRGVIMLLLAAESCMVWHALHNVEPVQPFAALVDQFFHHPWHGLTFWDLVQPSFMSMAGAALYISYSRKIAKGETWKGNWNHILLRSLKLFICGTALHCVYAGKPVWELWNVLTQLSITTLIAYLIINKGYIWQLIFTIGLLALTAIMYCFILMPGFDQPYVQYHNFGAYFDTLVMGKINQDGWVTINFIPTAAHTIWGVLAGKLLVSNKTSYYKIKALLIAGVIALAIGFGLDAAGIIPIIKRISTVSFVFASGGWVLIMLALTYWLVDVKQNIKHAWWFTVMGMNAIFIYLFFETVGMQWLNGVVDIFTGQMLHAFLGVPEKIATLVSALAALFAEWSLCY
ncbi:MAG: DUF5009 domain-containing protein, partial [Sphingobacteriales bacterium]